MTVLYLKLKCCNENKMKFTHFGRNVRCVRFIWRLSFFPNTCNFIVFWSFVNIGFADKTTFSAGKWVFCQKLHKILRKPNIGIRFSRSVAKSLSNGMENIRSCAVICTNTSNQKMKCWMWAAVILSYVSEIQSDLNILNEGKKLSLKFFDFFSIFLCPLLAGMDMYDVGYK